MRTKDQNEEWKQVSCGGYTQQITALGDGAENTKPQHSRIFDYIQYKYLIIERQERQPRLPL